MSIAGVDLLPLGQELLNRAGQDTSDANLWMNLSTVMLCLKQYEIGMAVRGEALGLSRIYRLAAARQPAKFVLLLLMAPGDLAANTPLDCLLENSDIDLIYYYVSPGVPLALPIPEHDALFVAMSDSDDNRGILAALEHALAHWPKPVINAPQYIPATGRDAASRLLQNAPGLLMPPTYRISLPVLLDLAAGKSRLPELFTDCDFPIILRPLASQAGVDLDKIERPEEISAYLARVEGKDFFLSRFIDYRAKDQLFRKARIALIDGVAYAVHMAASSDWMIHYVNAGMYEDAQKRAEEASFMEHFDAFANRHRAALEAIYSRIKLDYLCVDCAETQDGKLLIFELDHIMVVHAMDPEDQFPYKQSHIRKVQEAFRAYISRLAHGAGTA